MKTAVSLLVTATLALAAASVVAQTAAPPAAGTPPAIEDYVRPAQYGSANTSPNGRYLAVTTPVNGRLNLAVVDLETRKGTALTNFGEFDVIEVHWINDDRLVFSLGQQNSPTGPGQFLGGGFFTVSREGGDARKLAPTIKELRAQRNNVLRQMSFERRIPGSNDEILISANLRSADAYDIYRLNVLTGRTTLITSDRPSHSEEWVLDNNRVPRVVRAWIKDTLTYVTQYRSSADAPWREIARIDRTSGDIFDVKGFLSDNKTLLVSTNQGRETAAMFRFDPETGKLGEMLAAHPKYDVETVVTEPDTDRVLGFTVNAEKPTTVWTDEKEARTQATIDAALKTTRNVFSRFPNSSRILVQSYSDVEPRRYYLLDEQKRTLEELFNSKPWLTPQHLVEMRPFVLKTRDGLEIPSYYFLPRNYKPGDKLPTVIHIHGGPTVRADWWASGFGYLEGQILASRGYAVVLPNFRITPGFGRTVFKSGFGTIGRQMSEDHEDAVKWAVDQGFADPRRVCISGASYGGYAVLRALAKTPELFKCGVAGLMVSDLELQLTSTSGDSHDSPAVIETWHRIIGKDASGKVPFREVSPLHMADRIKAPLFVYAGSDDIRTPLEQTNAMVRALSRAGNEPKEVLIKKEEGHGFGKVENNVDLYTRMLKFLDEQIGSKAR